MSEHSPLSPEARAEKNRGQVESEDSWFHRMDIPHQVIEVFRRVGVGVYNNGFTHAGNFAYLALLAVFSFFIVAAAFIGTFGESGAVARLLEGFFTTLPPSVGAALHGPVESAMAARSGPVLWLSVVVGLWTTGSLIEAFREILNEAYGTELQGYFWQYRLGSAAITIAAVFLTMLLFSAQVAVASVEQLISEFLPDAQRFADYFKWRQILPFGALFLTIFIVFRSLTPHRYRDRRFRKWPGAALVSLWWVICAVLLPLFVANTASYDLTYGSLAGVMITLIFFYLIGLGLVTGAQLNAALANADANGLERENNDDVKE